MANTQKFTPTNKINPTQKVNFTQRIPTNKFSIEDNRRKFRIRLRTSIIVFLYCITVLVIGLFASNQNQLFYTPQSCKVVFGIVLILFIFPLTVLSMIELTNACYIKTNHVIHARIVNAVFGVIGSVAPIILMFPWIYHYDTQRNYQIYLGVSLTLLVSCAVILFIYNLVILLKVQKIHVFWLAITFSFIMFVFSGIYYIIIIKFFTTFLFLLMVTWLVDSSAYIGGSFFGKHKMSPHISPNKTWEGFISSIIVGGVLLFCFLGCCWPNKNICLDIFGRNEFNWGQQPWSYGSWWACMLPIVVGLSLTDVIGDLYFSWIKRGAGIKDYSNFLPGHGGILDRIDALIFIVFVYVIISFICSISTDPTLQLFYL